MLRPGRIASPAPARAFTFELSPPESPHEGVEYNYAGKSANSRGRTCTGRTSSIMGCKQSSRSCSVHSVSKPERHEGHGESFSLWPAAALLNPHNPRILSWVTRG